MVVTSDGKEYVTRRHLITEVQNEGLANGRVALTSLVPVLRVELDHVEAAATALVSERSDEFVLCAGELISRFAFFVHNSVSKLASREHLNSICAQVNDRLQEVGQMSMFSLTKNYNLSTELLNHYVLAELGGRIDATRHEDQLYTRQFYELQNNKLRAALVAITWCVV